MSERETRELKRLLVDHYANLLKDEVEKDVAKKGYTQKDFDDILVKVANLLGTILPMAASRNR